MKKIVFAFALSNDNLFANKYFGDADKFAIYSYSKIGFNFVEEFQNSFNTDENGNIIDINQKREQIVSLLKSKNVSVMVSRKFSQYLRKVSDEFLPVIVEKENPDEVVEILAKNIKWIKDEFKNRKSGYMLFRIKTGVLKSTIH
jgi:hypothetical protein